MASIYLNNHSFFLSSTGIINFCEKLSRISTIGHAILKTLGEFILFPTRYFGAKDWSLPGLVLKTPYYLFRKILNKDCSGFLGKGYHKSFEKKITLEEDKKYLPFVAASVGSHSPEKYFHPFGLQSINPKELTADLSDLTPYDTCFLDHSTGVKISLFQNSSSEIIIAFGAKNSAEYLFPNDVTSQKKIKRKQDYAIAKNLLGLTPEAYVKTAKQLKELLFNPFFKEKKITFTGTCFGGSLAQYSSLKLKIPAICFNSLQIGPGLQATLGSEALSNADNLITNITVKKDFLNDNIITNLANRVLSIVGIKTPGNFGRQYFIPTAYDDSRKSHVFVLGAFMKYLGINERTLPGDLPKEFFH